MIYLDQFTFPDGDMESGFFQDKVKRTCYDSYYPFQVLPGRGLERLDFDPITILYGGNGSGKSTLLNIIAEKTEVPRDAIYNKSSFFPDYVAICEMELKAALPEHSRIITSDDVFDYMLNIRSLNEGIDRKREELFDDYLEAKYSRFQLKSLADYEELKRVNHARFNSQSRFVRKENSLSPKRQLELMKFIEDSARFWQCQFIIATHSPFLLALRGAKVYDLDENPVAVKRWTELENVRIYYDFFKKRESEF
ncbi:ATP-binding cassette domain-containing protein [Desulfitobacterium chlororespirans]|uniref:Predicted ATPase n=1 Tax=Desulfitobacterium chlororespirans DSM 11544 TaxID=1121395 RepID=A0A1M7SM24_9FIRM|nr:ATP-binding cassette domain-containing protein [Desulfitobacterium chlororespirans]SHN59501.1 Predicted ATPase [Desulfitobacterium chlororespirans DSM 11544]